MTNADADRTAAELLAAYDAAVALEKSLSVRRGRPATAAQICAWDDAARAARLARAAYRTACGY